MPRKMPRRLVALSTSAIAAVYLAGLVTTHVAAADPTALPSSATTAITTVAQAPTTASTVAVARFAAGQSSTSTASTLSGYRDGSYTGTGSSRFGTITVSVTVQAGRIASVDITGATTSFPVSRIATLPGQVVARQSVQLDKVTGATYSTQAFKQAVQQALAQAQTSPSTASA